MGYGSGILLIVIGAILAFAVHVQVAGIDLKMVGYICLLAGILVLIISAIASAARGRTRRVETVETHHADGVADVHQRETRAN